MRQASMVEGLTDEQQAEIVERTLAGQLLRCKAYVHKNGSLRRVECDQVYIEWGRHFCRTGKFFCPWCAVKTMEVYEVTVGRREADATWSPTLSAQELEHLAEARVECERQAWLKA